MDDPTAPLIVVTVTNVALHADRDLATRKNERYAEAVRRHGGRPILVDGTLPEAERAAAFAAMAGLLLSGGADIDPEHYGRPNQGSVDIEPDRDALEVAAWEAAETREVPVLGICRGFQAINVFAGGTLIQDVPSHAGPGWTTGPALMHPIRIGGGSILAEALAEDPIEGIDDLPVNSYHHQAVGRGNLAPGLEATAWIATPGEDIVEGLELPGERFVVGVQCHPERTEFSPPGFENLWAAFVAAARTRAARPDGAPAS